MRQSECENSKKKKKVKIEETGGKKEKTLKRDNISKEKDRGGKRRSNEGKLWQDRIKSLIMH